MKLSDGMVVCDLEHKHHVGTLCVFNKILCNPNHALEAALSEVRVHAMLTRLLVSIHFGYVDVHRSLTLQFSRSFLLMIPALLVMV